MKGHVPVNKIHNIYIKGNSLVRKVTLQFTQNGTRLVYLLVLDADTIDLSSSSFPAASDSGLSETLVVLTSYKLTYKHFP